ncbi:MAG: pentapeptide repeat-containing protein [Acetatifactor sp.]|nr:pentapeptide repeat-containing protein [Acetatifactor sp.]
MIKIYRTHDMPLKFNVDTLRGMKLDNTCFHRCLLNNFNMSNASFVGCDFCSAKMRKSDFNHSNFDESRLIMVEGNSNFDYCTFKKALVLHNNFCGSSFQYADFSDSVIKNDDFSKCDLRGAKITCDGLESCSWIDAIYDDSTLWQEDFKAYEYGAIKV